MWPASRRRGVSAQYPRQKTTAPAEKHQVAGWLQCSRAPGQVLQRVLDAAKLFERRGARGPSSFARSSDVSAVLSPFAHTEDDRARSTEMHPLGKAPLQVSSKEMPKGTSLVRAARSIPSFRASASAGFSFNARSMSARGRGSLAVSARNSVYSATEMTADGDAAEMTAVLNGARSRMPAITTSSNSKPRDGADHSTVKVEMYPLLVYAARQHLPQLQWETRRYRGKWPRPARIFARRDSTKAVFAFAP